MYDIFEKLMKEKGVRPFDVAKATGITPSTFSDWKKGRAVPKTEKLKKIADYFGVSLGYLTGADEPPPDVPYDIILYLRDNPECEAIVESLRGVKPRDLHFIAELIERLK